MSNELDRSRSRLDDLKHDAWYGRAGEAGFSMLQTSEEKADD